MTASVSRPGSVPAPRFVPTVIIPVYNHPATIEAVVKGVRAQGASVIVVDDGSNAETAAACERCAALGATVIHRRTNGGKGAAMVTGFKAAVKAGATHALQIDADGQHDLSRVTPFLALAAKFPKALICGYPQYDKTVPLARLWGRKLTNFWVCVNAWTLTPEDAMCGMRVYPLAAVQQLLARQTVGQRMDFDPEILVRLMWMGVRVKNLPVAVTYPADGVSHFDQWMDNVRISWMHTKLCVTMLTRLPFILFSRATGWQPREPNPPTGKKD